MIITAFLIGIGIGIGAWGTVLSQRHYERHWKTHVYRGRW